MVYEELLYMGMMMGGVFGIVGVILFQLVQKKRWPIRIPYIIQRGKSGNVWDLDERGRYAKNKEGYEVIKLKKRKQNIKPMKFEDTASDLGGKLVYPVYNTAGGQVFPIKLMQPPRFEVIEDASSKNWAILELNRVRQTYQKAESVFMKYAPYIMNATFAAMVIFFVIYFAGKMEAVSGNIAGASSALSNALNAFTGKAAPPAPTTTIPANAQVVP